MNRVCVVLFAIMCAEAGVIGGRAFFCRDPDTGKLHPVNTSWASNSFCGNYHCRLRRKNLTATEYAPMRQINISNIDLGKDTTKQVKLFSDDSFYKKVNLKKNSVDVTSINNLLDFNLPNIIREEAISETKQDADENDRYLTKKEIETISAVLHTLKRSDLDAVLEIYSLVQDIYKEIDNTSPDHSKHDTGDNNKQHSPAMTKSQLDKVDEKKIVSYWYDPFAHGKQRSFNILGTDLDTLGTNLLKLMTPKPTQPPQQKPTPLPPTKKKVESGGNVKSKDFGERPYYYPMSNFQKQSPNVHRRIDALPKVFLATTKASEKQAEKKATKYQKDIQPSIYLPYPFSFIPRYKNWTYSQPIYYGQRYIERHEKKKDEKRVPKNVILINPDLENYQEDEIKAVEPLKEEKSILKLISEKSMKSKHKHDWQTDPISKQILEDARAHIEKTRFRPLKSFHLGKKIKLERVGKLFKLDEINPRNKRETDQVLPDLFEVYLERSTCQPDTVPGFFRFGNTSQPFPDCCPQRIL